MASAVSLHTNLMFLCDNCKTVSHPSTLVNVCSALNDVSAGLTAVKNVVSDLSAAVNSHTAQLPPAAIFGKMITSLDEINTSLHTLNEGQQATINADASATAILRDIQTNLTNKEATPPLVDANELKDLLTDVRAAFDNKGRDNVRGNFRSLNSPSGFGPSPGPLKGKRRLDMAPTDGQPAVTKRQKPDIVGTGPSNDDLVTVPKPSDELLGYKSMVASRFSPQTDSAKILSYVKEKLSLPAESDVVTVRSLAPRNRPLTFISFKISVPDEHYDKLMESTFWPANTTIRAFEQREPKVASFF